MTIELQEITRQVAEATKEQKLAIARHDEAASHMTTLEQDWREKYDDALLSSKLKSKELREAEARTLSRKEYRAFVTVKRKQQNAKAAMHAWGQVHETLKALAWSHHAEIKGEIAA